MALEPLARQLGYRPDPRNRARWKRNGSVLAIDGSRFFDHRQGRGGGGAVDLVMHARGCRFQQAVEFLEASGPPAPRPPASPVAPPRPLRLPQRHDRLWPRVRDYLAAARGLDPRLLQLCHHAGLLYPDRRGNAVFLCRDPRRSATGAEIVGTRPDPRDRTFKAMAPGSRKARGGFWLLYGPAPPGTALLVESAVDALSALQLLAPELPPGTLLASTAGVASRLPAWLQAFRCQHLVCAYDADPAGDAAATALRRSHPRLVRLRTLGAKDWNQQLRRSAQPL